MLLCQNYSKYLGLLGDGRRLESDPLWRLWLQSGLGGGGSPDVVGRGALTLLAVHCLDLIFFKKIIF